MLDFSHLPTATSGSDVQIFTAASTSTSFLDWKTWLKPRGKTMAHILCIGGGGGGGGGFTGAASSARGGGGGGGSSGVCRVTIPLFLLPDMLFVAVGAGGQGVGSGGGTAGSGVLSFVSVAPSFGGITANCIAKSGSVASVGGTTGTAGAVGTGGAASTIAAIGDIALVGAGLVTFVAGQAGVNGGAVAGGNGTAITIPVTSTLCQAGSGGGGTTSADFAGGACTSIANSWLSEQRPATPAAGSFNGSGGLQLWKPFFSFGGLGGGASNAGIGGGGGPGAYGAGGGGGGGGTTGGRGGDGGSGLVMIICW
jgi:hypothetical protein